MELLLPLVCLSGGQPEGSGPLRGHRLLTGTATQIYLEHYEGRTFTLKLHKLNTVRLMWLSVGRTNSDTVWVNAASTRQQVNFNPIPGGGLDPVFRVDVKLSFSEQLIFAGVSVEVLLQLGFPVSEVGQIWWMQQVEVLHLWVTSWCNTISDCWDPCWDVIQLSLKQELMFALSAEVRGQSGSRRRSCVHFSGSPWSLCDCAD